MVIDKYGKKWFKGNTHTHTTNSDGRLSPDDTKKLYKSHGYDFLALTEHWKPSAESEFEGMTILSGVEYHIGGVNTRTGVCHIVAVGFDSLPALSVENSDSYTPQQIVDAINAAGGAAIYAHPAWSVNRVSMLLPIDGLSGIEVFNSVSDQPVNSRAYSEWIIDLLAIDGKLIPCVAADDSHWYSGEECRGSIMVRAEECSADSIVAAIKRGEYYATQGPVYTFEVWRDRIIVDCSPVNAAVFQSNREWIPNRRCDGNGMTHIEYEINPGERFVRFELLDADGRIGWSNPIDVTSKGFSSGAFEYHDSPAPHEFRCDGTVRA